ncbi:hypothetical protein A3729_16855 [Oleiphilus sp. HI0043]|nr:hypothetical protein A3729_16855 [Oleiphilus sp. HI0043]KZZ63331.1 hypothetical protein A3763_06745 [Oleiphilus sp. HI0128]
MPLATRSAILGNICTWALLAFFVMLFKVKSLLVKGNSRVFGRPKQSFKCSSKKHQLQSYELKNNVNLLGELSGINKSLCQIKALDKKFVHSMSYRFCFEADSESTIDTEYG